MVDGEDFGSKNSSWTSDNNGDSSRGGMCDLEVWN